MGPPSPTAPPVVENRRSFLAWVINGIGAIFAVILGVPIVAYIIDPRNRKGAQGNFKAADGVRLTELAADKPIQQGVIRDVRRDAWTLYPNDVLGRVWVVLQPGKEIPGTADQRKALRSHASDAADAAAVATAPIKVFTTICPHLGCSVNLASDQHHFLCPCHSATFGQEGQRLNPEHNPAQRGLDELAWKVDPDDPESNRIVVKYRNFKSSVADKKELT